MFDLDEHVDRFATEILADALRAAEGRYWRRRAHMFDEAAPRPNDFTGNATPEQIEALRERLAAKAEACREQAKHPTTYEVA